MFSTVTRNETCLIDTRIRTKQAQSKVPPQKWDRIDQNTLGEGQYFGHNFSRPQFPSSTARPGTANSTRSTSNWRAVFKNPAMTSSMVDLAPPQRRPSVGSLRHAASDLNLRPGTALPAPLGGSGLRPGTPSRPSGAVKADWVNPLDVHFCRDPTSSRPGTPLGSSTTVVAAPTTSAVPASPKNRLGQFDFGQSAGGEEASRNIKKNSPQTCVTNCKPDEEPATQNGYPSPPQSDRNSDRAFSPVNVPASEKLSSSSKRNAPSALRKVDVPGPKALPSPAPSVQGSGEDRADSPVVRNVPARRDTFAFHQPRRRSFTMEFEDSHRATMMNPPKEGFSGNFADFDFGEIVSKTTSNTSVKEEKPNLDVTRSQIASSEPTRESLVEPAATYTRSTPSPSIRQADREGSKSPAPTYVSEDQVANSTLIDQLPKPPREPALRPLGPPPAAAGAHKGPGSGPRISPRQGFQSRFDAERSSRAPPPRPLRPVVPVSAADHVESAIMSPYGPPPDSGSSYMRDETPVRPAEKLPSSPFSRPPMEGNFPVTKGLPRGRRPGPPPLKLATSNDEYALSLPAWSDFDRADPRLSAMPAPLTPIRPNTSHGTGSGISTPTSATAPRLPSPTFSSLSKSISTSSPTFGAFEINFDEPLNSPTLGGFPSVDRQPSTSAGSNSKRVEAKRAPPRPAPVTLPPSATKDGGTGIKSPALTEFPGTFI